MLDQITRTQTIARALDRDLDHLIAELRPAAPLEGEFGLGLSAVVKRWSEQSGIAAECAVSSEAARRLPDDTAPNLYAITHEALHNVAKHARATSVNVTLSQQEDCAVLLIEDDGRGFDPSVAGRRRTGFGLIIMQERAELAGGEFAIESSTHGGTTVCVRVPLDRQSATVRAD